MCRIPCADTDSGLTVAAESLCKRALEQHGSRLIRLKNVVGLGIVPVEDSPKGFHSRDLVVAVYVAKKLPLEQLAPQEVIPPALEVPSGKRILKVPTRVIEQGEVSLEPLE